MMRWFLNHQEEKACSCRDKGGLLSVKRVTVDPQKVCHESESLGWHFASRKTSERNSFFMPKHESLIVSLIHVHMSFGPSKDGLCSIVACNNVHNFWSFL
jgi:hypothetical protein